MTICPSRISVRLAALLLAICVLSGSASASTQEWRIRTKGTVDSALFSAHRLVWAEAVGTNGFRILIARLGEQPRLVAQIPNRRVGLRNDGHDWAYLSLAAWPGGIAYGYAGKPYYSQMRIVVVPFGRPARVLWAKSCRKGHTLPQVAITHRRLLTNRGSCSRPPNNVEESDLLGTHPRELPLWASQMQASGGFASFVQPAMGDNALSITAIVDLRTRETVLTIPGDITGPATLASDGALIFSAQPEFETPWQVVRASPAEPSPHPIVDDLPDSPAVILTSHGRIAIARSGRFVERPTRIDVFTRSGRRLGGLPKAVHGEFGADVLSFDGRRVAWVIRGPEDPGPETIVVRCVLDCE